MIRIETDSGWILVEHREHARLAGRMAAHWGNAEFAPPEPRAAILEAVARHDDAWALRDETPSLTREGRPSAFSRELVGKYSAFEEMDFADYLAVRGRAAQAVAADNPYAAVIISMHTVSLLTTQADLERALAERHRTLHQRVHRGSSACCRRSLQIEKTGRRTPLDLRPRLNSAPLRRAFEFLQACDSLSLGVCVRYPTTKALRHRHPRRDGSLATLDCIPLGGDTYRVALLSVRRGRAGASGCRAAGSREGVRGEAAFRDAFAAAPLVPLPVVIVR